MLVGPGSEEAYARAAGFPTHLARLDAIREQERRYERAERWRQQTGFYPAAAGVRRVGEFAPTAEQLARDRAALGLEVREITEEEPTP